MSINKRILSLGGGGFLGLFSVRVVEEIEDMSGCPAWQSYDLFAGTSVGGIIALGLAAEQKASTIRAAFEEYGPHLFHAKHMISGPFAPVGLMRRAASSIRAFWRPKYSSAVLRKLIETVVGTQTKLGDLSQKVVIPAVNLSTGLPCVFKTPHHSNFTRDAKLNLVDVALATAAAPTYFAPHRIGNEVFADGGLFANCPDDIALVEGLHYLNFQEHSVQMTSISVPTQRKSIAHKSAVDMGVLHWLKDARLSTVLISSQHYNSSAMMRMRLGHRYLKITEEVPANMEKLVGFDRASREAQEALLALAESAIRRAAPTLLQSGFIRPAST